MAFQQPTFQQPTFQQPIFQQPTFQQPMFQQPTFQQPTFQQPTFQQPTFQQPTFQQPTFQQPTFQQQLELERSRQAHELEMQRLQIDRERIKAISGDRERIKAISGLGTGQRAFPMARPPTNPRATRPIPPPLPQSVEQLLSRDLDDFTGFPEPDDVPIQATMSQVSQSVHYRSTAMVPSRSDQYMQAIRGKKLEMRGRTVTVETFNQLNGFYSAETFYLLWAVLDPPPSRQWSIHISDGGSKSLEINTFTRDIGFVCFEEGDPGHWFLIHVRVKPTVLLCCYDSLHDPDEALTKAHIKAEARVVGILKANDIVGSLQSMTSKVSLEPRFARTLLILPQRSIRQADGNSCGPLTWREFEVLMGCPVPREESALAIRRRLADHVAATAESEATELREATQDELEVTHARRLSSAPIDIDNEPWQNHTITSQGNFDQSSGITQSSTESIQRPPAPETLTDSKNTAPSQRKRRSPSIATLPIKTSRQKIEERDARDTTKFTLQPKGFDDSDQYGWDGVQLPESQLRPPSYFDNSLEYTFEDTPASNGDDIQMQPESLPSISESQPQTESRESATTSLTELHGDRIATPIQSIDANDTITRSHDFASTTTASPEAHVGSPDPRILVQPSTDRPTKSLTPKRIRPFARRVIADSSDESDADSTLFVNEDNTPPDAPPPDERLASGRPLRKAAKSAKDRYKIPLLETKTDDDNSDYSPGGAEASSSVQSHESEPRVNLQPVSASNGDGTAANTQLPDIVFKVKQTGKKYSWTKEEEEFLLQVFETNAVAARGWKSIKKTHFPMRSLIRIQKKYRELVKRLEGKTEIQITKALVKCRWSVSENELLLALLHDRYYRTRSRQDWNQLAAGWFPARKGKALKSRVQMVQRDRRDKLEDTSSLGVQTWQFWTEAEDQRLDGLASTINVLEWNALALEQFPGRSTKELNLRLFVLQEVRKLDEDDDAVDQGKYSRDPRGQEDEDGDGAFPVTDEETIEEENTTKPLPANSPKDPRRILFDKARLEGSRSTRKGLPDLGQTNTLHDVSFSINGVQVIDTSPVLDTQQSSPPTISPRGYLIVVLRYSDYAKKVLRVISSLELNR
ncbi:MAG: hypothetical protein Q9184_005540 [Pyrenodesmia sp. 2 TL-2023]